MLKQSRTAVLLAGALAGLGGLSGVAEAAEEARGPRVRVTAPAVDPKPLVGVLAEMGSTALVLARGEDGDSVTIPRDSITRLEVSRRPSRKGRGVSIGALSGIAIGAALGYAAGEDCEGNEFLCFDRGPMAAGTALAGMLVGSLVGYLAAPGEQWEVAGPDSLRLDVQPIVPPRGGVGLSVSLSF